MKTKFLADLHVHTNYSDGQHSVSEIVDLYGLQGFGAIAITDHICEEKSWLGRTAVRLNKTLTKESFANYICHLQSEAERAWKQYGMVLIPGYELSKNSFLNHRSAHILGLGITEFQWADGSAVELARNIRSQGGLAIAAHPVWTGQFEKQTYYLWDNRENLKNEFDAWEVASGTYLFPAVKKSGLPIVASGDLHSRKQMSSWKTVFSCERTQDAILDAVRGQNLDIYYYHEKQSYDYVRHLSKVNHLTLSEGKNDTATSVS